MRLSWSNFRLIIEMQILFISNPIFRLSLELLSEVPKMRLKVAMKLFTFFDDYGLTLTKLGKIEESCPEFPIWGSGVASQVAMILENLRLGRPKFGLFIKKSNLFLWSRRTPHVKSWPHMKLLPLALTQWSLAQKGESSISTFKKSFLIIGIDG